MCVCVCWSVHAVHKEWTPRRPSGRSDETKRCSESEKEEEIHREEPGGAEKESRGGADRLTDAAGLGGGSERWSYVPNILLVPLRYSRLRYKQLCFE